MSEPTAAGIKKEQSEDNYVTKEQLNALLNIIREFREELHLLKADKQGPPFFMVSEPTPPPPPAQPMATATALIPSTSDDGTLQISDSEIKLTSEEETDLEKWEAKKIKATQGSRNPAFTGEHWLGWKRTTLLDLTQARLVSLLTSEPPLRPSSLEEAKLRAGDSIVQAYLLTRLSADVLKDVANCKTAKAVWDKLTQIHENATIATKNKLQDKWNALTQKSGQSMQSFIRDIEYMILQMTNIGMD